VADNAAAMAEGLSALSQFFVDDGTLGDTLLRVAELACEASPADMAGTEFSTGMGAIGRAQRGGHVAQSYRARAERPLGGRAFGDARKNAAHALEELGLA
jgi:hypothetical protein